MSKRNSILDSAQALVIREGSSALTLDRIAGEAKVSKGGLLYHFATKENLVAALVSRSIEYLDKEIAICKKRFGDGPGANTQAFIAAMLEGQWAAKAGLAPHGLDLFATSVAAFSTSPDLIAPLRAAYTRWQASVEADRADPTLTTIARLAADGLWFTEFLGLSTFGPKQRARIIKQLKILALSKQHRPAGPNRNRKGKTQYSA
jgi:AcrR family transcriptional regulator